jgi:putative oxidoreductase
LNVSKFNNLLKEINSMSTHLKNRSIWVLQILLALAFLAASGSKLAGVAPMVKMFDDIGFGQWFRVVTGLTEVAAALLLLTTGLAGLGGLVVLCTMLGATATHLFLIGGNPLPAITLGLLGGAVFILRRDQLGPLQALLPVPLRL